MSNIESKHTRKLPFGKLILCFDKDEKISVLTTSGRLIIQSFCMDYLKVGQKLGIFKDEIFKSKIQSFSCLRTERTEKFMTTAQQEGTQMDLEFYYTQQIHRPCHLL